jgi:hypothetical protein
MVYRRFLGPSLAFALLGYSGLAAAQEVTYSVREVETAPPARAALDLSTTRLPTDLAVVLPDTDGATFMAMPASKDVTASTTGEVSEILDELLPAIGWDGTAADLSLGVEGRALVGPDEAALKTAQDEGLANFRRDFAASVGNPTDTSDAAMADAVDETVERAEAANVVWRFDQLIDGVPCEGMGIVVSTNARTLRGITGALYADTAVANRDVIGATRAESVALSLARETSEAELGEAESELVIIPDGADLYEAWRVEVRTTEGPYRIWVNAEDGAVMRVRAEFRSASAQGLAYDWSPTQGTADKSFEVDAAVGGSYALGLADTIVLANGGADGTTTSLALTDDGSGFADFDTASFNDTTNLTTATSAGYNPWFQQVHAFAWAYDVLDWFAVRGSETLPAWTVTVNHADPCGFGVDNACGGYGAVTFGVGSTIGSGGVLLNSVLDATVIVHEMGHGLNALQNTVGKGTINGSIDEGIADYWSMSRTGQDTFGGAWAAGGAPQQGGYVPRQADAADVFPEHLYLGNNNEFHANGQVIAWALWSARAELVARNPIGAYAADLYLMKALTAACVGQSGAQTDKAIHDSMWAVMVQMVVQAGSSQDATDILAGFARAGIIATEKEAIVSISDDYLSSTGAAPSFTVWTGRDFEFDGTGTVVTTADYNNHYEIEVASDEAFTNPISSGERTDVAVTNGVPMATWTLASADWDTLKTGTELYYRVTTWDDAEDPDDTRTSTHFYGEFFDMPAGRAVINVTGTIEEDCQCGSGCDTTEGRQGVAVLGLMLGALTAVRRRAQG